jgi:hypothetical protein
MTKKEIIESMGRLYIVRSGGMVNAFGPDMGHKVTHPKRGMWCYAVKGLTIKTNMTAGLLAIRTTCGKWPRGPRPNY